MRQHGTGGTRWRVACSRRSTQSRCPWLLLPTVCMRVQLWIAWRARCWLCAGAAGAAGVAGAGHSGGGGRALTARSVELDHFEEVGQEEARNPPQRARLLVHPGVGVGVGFGVGVRMG